LSPNTKMPNFIQTAPLLEGLIPCHVFEAVGATDDRSYPKEKEISTSD
jgi:hypothetical protein